MATTGKMKTEELAPLIRKKHMHHGSNIANLRDVYGWSQKDLAEKLKWRQQKVSKLEEMAVIPDETLIEVAKAFGISPESLKYTDVREKAMNVF